MANHFAFIDESGVLDESNVKQPYFAVGLLRIEDTAVIGEELTKHHYDYFSVQRQERKKLFTDLASLPRTLNPQDLNLLLLSTRHHEYKFTNITPTTLERYKRFIDTALGFPLHFCALVIDKTDPLFNSSIYKNYWDAYIKYAKLLCEQNCPPTDGLCVVADYMHRPNQAATYFEHELNALPNVFHTMRAHSETFMLLQLSDLLLGSVLFQWRQANGYTKTSNRAAAKADFVSHLLGKFDLPSAKQGTYPLSQAITLRDPIYLNVVPLHISKM